MFIVAFLLGENVAAAHASARFDTLKWRERFREAGFFGVFGGICP